MKTPLISVVMPTYNREWYLNRAIDSVLNQTYPHIQLIVVDDGSTDGTGEVLEGIQDERLEYYPLKKNHQICYALNYGLEKVKGEYVARLDSDDEFALDKLEKQLYFLQQNPEYKICFSRAEIINEDGDVVEHEDDALFDVSGITREELLRHFFFQGNCLAHGAVLMEKSVLDHVGNYNLCFVQLQDYDLWVRIAKMYPVYLMDEPLYKMRRTGIQGQQRISERTSDSERRSANESRFILRRFFDGMEEELFTRTFKEYFRYSKASSAVDIKCEQAFLYEKRGALDLMSEKLEQIFQTQEGLEVLLQTYDYTLKDFYQMQLRFANPVTLTKDVCYQDSEKGESEIGILQMHVEECRQEIDVLETEINNKAGHIELLLERERELERIKSSCTWRLASTPSRIKNVLLPEGSKRKVLMKLIRFAIMHPGTVISKLSPENRKILSQRIRTEGLSSLAKQADTSREHIRKQQLRLRPVEREEHPLEWYAPMTFTFYENPVVSIIIPVFNQFNYTYNCLCSVLKYSASMAYEVIVADDCSTDLTTQLQEIAANIRVVRTKTNSGFLLNSNHAADYARGKYLLFLNNDTQVQKDWLEPLVGLMEQDDTIGLVGSKLVYPDGVLQEAGGILWKDGSAWNYGNGKSPMASEYNYVKEVDYISGAAIMIRSGLWQKIGGFDTSFVPAYCEDSDLAFEVRSQGYKVVYQPNSVVVHFEGISNGTDIRTELKQYQIKNTKKFLDKWKEVLENHFENGRNVFKARERAFDKPIILVIDHYVPEYDRDAGSKTTFQFLKMFLSKGYVVKFAGDNFYQKEPYTTVLQQMGIEVLYGKEYEDNILRWIKGNENDIDYIYLNRPHIAIKYLDFIKKETGITCIYYGHDLHFLRLEREYDLTGDPAKHLESEKWKDQELYIMRNAHMSYYPSAVEVEAIQAIDPTIKVKAITAYVFADFRNDIDIQFTKKHGLLFVGGFGHPPNVDGVLWFAKEIYPLIQKVMQIPFYVVGANVPQEIKALHRNGINIKGYVSEEELKQLYDCCKLAVIPLRYGAGVKGKVVEAFYNGIPLVTTSVGAEGIDAGPDVMDIADDAESFAAHVLSLYENDRRLAEIAQAEQEYVKQYYCEEAVWKVVRDDFEK